MGEWLPQSGETSGPGVAYELYRNDPTDTAPEDLVTEIYVPLA
jgi:AraC family transcriptional regulator